ncbi:MarR family transcriptional regulator [Mycobacterium sp. pR1184]|uniref:MarR family transcriptional regulator n=1 Tax=Mycobacterium sp. pR1184 TaxID=3238981 RepID=UPI00351AF350
MVHPTFTPSTMAADELDAITVGRAPTFETLVDRIKGGARDGSRPHTLIVAPRGAGKTHTLHVTVHRSLADPLTAKSILPVFIPEDSLAIGSYIDLLVEIARSIDDGLATSAREMRRQKDAIGIEHLIIDAAGGRMILLAIENLDRVFDSLGSNGQGALRAWVETSTAITVFATAPTLFTGVSSRSYPWYGSFIVESLPELTVDDAVVMLAEAARRNSDEALATFIESAQGRERLQVVHRLAGGSPRLWHILSEAIDIESLDVLVPAVESLLDRLAPYYQQQLWQLPAGEQRLVVELARGWEPRTVTDLAAAVGVSNQSAAAALGRLTASRWVASTKAESGDRRASWYDLTEPLLRYHLQYREDRSKPLRLIVEFLRGFYSRERLLAELADAVPDSPVERHLQHALDEGGTWYAQRPLEDDPKSLLAIVRTWMIDKQQSLSDIAIILEAILVAALEISSRRTVPQHLTEIVADAIAAQTSLPTVADKVRASLQNLRLRDWADDADDALSLFEFFCKTADNRALYTHTRRCAAVRGRHISKPALMLRLMTAFWLKHDGKADEALAALDDTLDDIYEADGVDESDRHLIWALWFETVPLANKTPRMRPGDADVGWELAIALYKGDIRPEQFDAVMASFTCDTRSTVATIVAVATAQLGFRMPPEHDPRRYVDEEMLAPIARFVADLAKKSATESDS